MKEVSDAYNDYTDGDTKENLQSYDEVKKAYKTADVASEQKGTIPLSTKSRAAKSGNASFDY